MNPILLDARNIHFFFEDRQVLEDVSFQLHRGEMLGLVGPNGSGKTVLLKLLLNLLPLQHGSVQWFGHDLKHFENWPKLGYVSQKSNSFNSGFPATVREVVLMGLTAKLGWFRRPGRLEDEKVLRALSDVGMADFADRNIGQLSGGQQQRVFIARALVSDPEVLILDEPTVGIDADNEAKFYQLLQNLNQDRNLSIILVSHDLGAVSTVMDTIACLNKKLHYHGSAKDFEHHRDQVMERTYGHEVHVLHHNH
jgi:zinc transport system ATP-binding protein